MDRQEQFKRACDPFRARTKRADCAQALRKAAEEDALNAKRATAYWDDSTGNVMQPPPSPFDKQQQEYDQQQQDAAKEAVQTDGYSPPAGISVASDSDLDGDDDFLRNANDIIKGRPMAKDEQVFRQGVQGAGPPAAHPPVEVVV